MEGPLLIPRTKPEAQSRIPLTSPLVRRNLVLHVRNFHCQDNSKDNTFSRAHTYRVDSDGARYF